MRRSLLAATLTAGLVLTGCAGGEPADANEAATATVTVTATPSESPEPSPTLTPISELKGGEIARILRGKLNGVTDLTVITEDNDPNDLIGRPGGYRSAAVLTDVAGNVSDPEPNVDWGATVEVFRSPTEAQRRKAYIQSVLESIPGLGTEYGYVSDGALLRVSGALKPSRAKRYRAAFLAIPRG